MNNYPDALKATLTSLIDEISETPELFVKNPGKDFTRNRKLTLATVIKSLVSMGGNSIYKELLESQGYNEHTATTSAFVQQRDKLLPCVFEFLLHEFTMSHTNLRTYRGYRLFASDGSILHIPRNPDDIDSYYQTSPDARGCNQLHMTALYDLQNRIYTDVCVQPIKKHDEYKAFRDMVKRSRFNGRAIIIADRNYESYNNFANIERKGWNYVIRVKDLTSKNGIIDGLRLKAEGEFDITVHRILTRKKTNEVKTNPELFKHISPKSPFDFLDKNTNKFYPISFRVVRFKIAENHFQTVITNLCQYEFNAHEIKALYKMRWGIETSFRELKYAVGLNNFHAKHRERIVQEVFARVIMYNFAEMITSHVIISKTDTKHVYQVNFTVAIHICRHFLRAWINAPPFDVEALIRKNTLPVRPDRLNKRNIRCKSAVSFLYRVA